MSLRAALLGGSGTPRSGQRYRTGTDPVQKWYRSGTEAGRGGNKSLGGQPRIMRYRPLKRAETIPRRIRPSNRPKSVANFQAVNALSCVSKRPKTRYRLPCPDGVAVLPYEIGN